MNSINRRLFNVIKTLKVTQAAFAKEVGISTGNLSDYKKKENKKPSAELLARISEIYKVNLNWLLTGQGSMFLEECSDCREERDIELERSRERIRELEAECEQIRADIASLREGHTGLKDKNEELSKQNERLNREIAERLREIVGLQRKLIPST